MTRGRTRADRSAELLGTAYSSSTVPIGQREPSPMDDPQSEPAKCTKNDNVPRRKMGLAADGVTEIVDTETDASHIPPGVPERV
jgi:hypothetical protein